MTRCVKIDKFELIVEELVCNKFGIAESFIRNYDSLNMLSDSLVLDVGCGVGPLSIFLAEKGFYVHAIDINKIAINLCIENVKKYKLDNRIDIFLENFATKKFNKKYDYIVTNPPIDDISDIVIDKTGIEKVKNGIINPRTFELITNSFRDENNKDLLTYIFEKSEEILNINGKIIVIFADLYGNSYRYVNNLYKKYNLRDIFCIKDTVNRKNIGLPNEMGENIDVYTIILER